MSFIQVSSVHLYSRFYSLISTAPYIPPIDPSNASDTQNFDDTFLDMEPVIKDENDNDLTDTDQEGRQTDTDRTDGEDSVTTPSQSRSPSVHPLEDDTVDVFDGYSFKGRHSVILDDEDEEEDGDESGEDEDEEVDDASVTGPSLDGLIPGEGVLEKSSPVSPVEEVPEPKTPEARPMVPVEPVAPIIPDFKTPIELKPEKVVESVSPSTPIAKIEPPVVPTKDLPLPPTSTTIAPAPPSPIVQRPQVDIPTKGLPPRQPAARATRNRREKSGVAALDRNLSDTVDEDGAATEREEDDDWDFVETNVDEERNGTKGGTSLFARGVVDRYRMVVFRKSTPRRSTNHRNVSGVSRETEVGITSEVDSPTPLDKQRRGRTTGLPFRRNPKQFLKVKEVTTPTSGSGAGSSSITGRASVKSKSKSKKTKSKSMTRSAGAVAMSLSTSSSAGFLTPSPSVGSTLPGSPSLKSKDSAISVGTRSESSEQSMNGDAARGTGGDTVKYVEEEKQKSKGLKKYKEGAEKVLSIFQSPR